MSDLRPGTWAEKELVIKKSRFIGRIFPVESKEEVEELLAREREREGGANHHCYAYVIDSRGTDLGYSDDGEPQGTAGLPILGVLQKRKLSHVLCVVTRYFGGIKLGAPGLVRAYGDACVAALSATKVLEYGPAFRMKIEFDYSYLGKIEYYYKVCSVEEIHRTFFDRVISEFWVPRSQSKVLMRNLRELSADRCRIRFVEKAQRPVGKFSAE